MAPYADGAELRVTDELALTHLAIPFNPWLSETQATRIAEHVAAAAAD
jgi:dTDP-4-amino-4,6-dideoxygalactose transaminase